MHFLRTLDDEETADSVWRVPTSMRSVEGEAGARMTNAHVALAQREAIPPGTAGPTDEDEF